MKALKALHAAEGKQGVEEGEAGGARSDPPGETSGGGKRRWDSASSEGTASSKQLRGSEQLRRGRPVGRAATRQVRQVEGRGKG